MNDNKQETSEDLLKNFWDNPKNYELSIMEMNKIMELKNKK